MTTRAWASGIPENEDTSSMIVALCFDICVCHQEYGKDDDHNVPTREDETSRGVVMIYTLIQRGGTHVNENAISPIFSGAYHAEKATMAGIWRRHT